ncbi:MAG: efflux RND transporter permease subunit [Gemmataceae bacterium]|nr:efflux RND transporter permease subunit [Gemmataceae bacterium]
MWLVNAALRNPYAVYVGMLLTAVLGIVSYLRTPTDILPEIKMPVVVVFASYRGMPAPDMERSVTAVLERALTRCDHLEHIESRSLLGIGIIKIFFRPQVDPDVASSQVISLVNGEMQFMPPGMLPPTIMKYDASAIPVGNLVVSSPSRDDKELLDIADHALRDDLAGLEGLASAPVFGGTFRQIQIYVHPRTLEAMKLSPLEVARIVNAQSQVIPTGEIRIGPPDRGQTYYVSSNSMAATIKDFEKLPLFNDGRKVVYLGDVASIVDGNRWRTNTVHVDGRRSVYMPLLRQAGASAVRVVDNVKAFLPQLHKRGSLPEDVAVEVVFDQSQYVRDALAALRLEGVLGALLASLVVLLFLGSLRGTVVVALSIPLSVLAALMGLYFTGHTLNIMTLGGLALILGRVVDDTIVDVENTVRHLGMGKPAGEAVRASAAEIAIPVLMATVTTVVVFFPLVFISGVAKYLFTPLAVSASLAMAASYLVSRTVSPLYCSRYLRPHHEKEHFPRWLVLAALPTAAVGLGVPALAQWAPDVLPEALADAVAWPFLNLHPAAQQVVIGVGAVAALTVLVAVTFWIAPAFDRLFEAATRVYERVLRIGLRWRVAVVGLVVAATVPAIWCFQHIGQELFPEVDTSEFTIHLRAKGGPRVETTERQITEIDRIVREIVAPEDLKLTLANIGLSSRWSAIYTPNNGPHAAFLRVQLRSGFDGRHTPALAYVDRLRERLHERYPGDEFFFETGGMIRRILNGGALAPIEIQIHGKDREARRQVARVLDARIDRIAQVTDTYLPQALTLPQLKVEVDRTAAARLKLTETDVVRNVITALMSSAQLAPNFWIDPASGNPYVIGVQYPEYVVESVQTLENIPISGAGRAGNRVPLVKDVAQIVPTEGPVEVYHFDVGPVNQLFVSLRGNDLARVAARVERIVAELPLEYARTLAPGDKLFAHALKELAEGGSRLQHDGDFLEQLRVYFEHPTPAGRAALVEYYDLDPESLSLFADEDFRAKMTAYLKKGRQSMREEIQRAWGLDPLPLKIPGNVRVEVRGEIANMRESFHEMGFNLALAVLLVYLVMAAQFSSWLDPLIMIVAAPLGLIGVAVMLWATGSSLNIQSLMGILMMVGISVSNSVLLVEFANRKRDEGHTPFEAVAVAARTRLRPILMTTLAAVAGLLPLAIHRHPGDEMNLPLARAVIGGLIGSTVLTLFIVPVLYLLFKPRSAARTTT